MTLRHSELWRTPMSILTLTHCSTCWKMGWKPVAELLTPFNWFFCAISNSWWVDKDLPTRTLEDKTIELVSTLKLLENIWRCQLAHMTITMIAYGFLFNVSQRIRKDFSVHCVHSFYCFLIIFLTKNNYTLCFSLLPEWFS